MGRTVSIDGETALMMSSAHLLTGNVQGATALCQVALSSEKMTRARALYTLSVLKIRHLPAALRDLDAAHEHLIEGWGILREMPFDEVASDIVLNRNCLALLQLRRGNGKQACSILRDTIEQLVSRGHGQTTAHSILLNNLGRAAARAFGEVNNSLAEESLEMAVKIDGSLPENWLELAHFRAKCGKFDKAIEAARVGCELSSTIPEMYEVLGFSLSKIRDHVASGEAYLSAAQTGVGGSKFALAGVREFLLAGQVDRTRYALNSVVTTELDDVSSAEYALLGLEAEQSDDPIYVETRLAEIVDRFPWHGLARRNLELAQQWTAGEQG